MPTLAEALFVLPTEKLRNLVRLRKLDAKKLALTPNKRQLAQFLSSELVKPASIADAILQCNARELRLLQLLLVGEHSQIVPWKDVLEAAGGAGMDASLTPVLDRLEELGLAFPAEDKAGERMVFLPDAIRAHIPASLSDRYSLTRCLNNYDAQAVKRICDQLGLKPYPSTKVANIEAIRAHLLDGAGDLRLTYPLSAQEVAVLEYMVSVGGAASAMEVAMAALDGQTDDFFRYDWQNRWKQGRERNAIDHLLARGILYVVAHGYGYNLFLIVPGDLLRRLSGETDGLFWSGPGLTPQLADAPPVATRQHEGLIRDIVRLFAALTATEAARTNTGVIHKTALKNIARVLSLPEERYASFLYALCREADLINVVTERQIYTITTRGNSWLHWDSVTQTRVLFEAWRKGALWAEMITDSLARSGEYRSLEAIVRIRQAALGIVAETPDSSETLQTNELSTQEIEKAAITKTARRKALPSDSSAPDLDDAPHTRLFADAHSLAETMMFRFPLLLAQGGNISNDIVASPAMFLRLLVGECLFWLGMAELGYDVPPPVAASEEERKGAAKAGVKTLASRSARTGGEVIPLLTRAEPAQKETPPEFQTFRLTDLGAFLLDVPNAPAPQTLPAEAQFILQANAEIFVPPFLAPATMYHLLALTDAPAKGATGNTVTLTRDSIRRALDLGETAANIVAFLQAHSRTGIPQNVEYLINEVSGKHGHIHIGRAQMYLQVDSPLLLKELEARRELKGYFVRTLGDTVALLRADDPDKLLRELRKAGYLPISDDAPRAATLSLKARAAPAPAPPLPDKKEKQALKADAALDWNRIAQDDNKSYSETREATGTVTNITRNPALIRTMLTQAIKNKTRVEIEYSEPGSSASSIRAVEPQRLMGSFLNALDQENGRLVSYNISRILSARLNGETFA